MSDVTILNQFNDYIEGINGHMWRPTVNMREWVRNRFEIFWSVTEWMANIIFIENYMYITMCCLNIIQTHALILHVGKPIAIRGFLF